MKNQTTSKKVSGDQNAAPKFIVLSKYGWGLSEDKAKAVRLCRSNSPSSRDRSKLEVYSAHPDTVMYGDGSWEYPAGKRPQLVETIT